MFRRMSIFGHLFSCAGRSLVFASSRLSDMSILSHPTQTSGKVELCDHARSRRMPLSGSKPEVLISRAPATECLHAHARVARMSWLLYGSDPRTPIACRWCLYSIRRAAFRTAFPRVSSWCDAERGDSLLEFHAHRWGACMHGALHVLVIHG